MTTHQQQMLAYMAMECGIAIPENQLQALCMIWMLWNDKCEQISRFTYRVEEVRDGTLTWAILSEYLGFAEPPKVPPVSRRENARRHQEFAWADLDRWPALRYSVMRQACRYGY